MIDEIQKSLKAAMYERLTTPLSGAFVISWVILNYKVVLYIFSNETIINKLDFIEKYQFSFSNFFGLPLLFALLWVLIHPVLSLAAFYWVEKIKFWKLDIKNKFENESNRIHNKIEIIQHDFNLKLAESTNQLKTQLQENANLRKEITPLSEKIQSEETFIKAEKEIEEDFKRYLNDPGLSNYLNSLSDFKLRDFEIHNEEIRHWLFGEDLISIEPSKRISITDKGNRIVKMLRKNLNISS